MPIPELPIRPLLPTIAQTLEDGDQAVLEAPPGAGKTTLVPLALLDAPSLQGKRIVMLEPRRVAARAAASRMAAVLGEPVGKTVGYRVRQDSQVSGETRVEVVTGGVLTRRLQEDPALEGVGLVIFDEFHERQLDSDLGLALCLYGRQLFRDAANPLKLLAMSATLNGDAVAALMGNAPIIRSHGKSFPVDVIYSDNFPLHVGLTQSVVKTVLRALEAHPGSALAFLPGQSEIRQVASALQDRLPPNVNVLPLFGAMPLDEQRRVIEPAPAGQRKLVLATDIAESSLTIEGVRIVIDAGRSRLPRFDPSTGLSRLTTQRVSQDSSIQRAGRAGRTEPGVCYRLWSNEQQHQLPRHSPPEILQTDLAPLALQLLNWGLDDPDELRWLDPPPKALYAQALELLHSLGAVSRTNAGIWQLTEHGRAMTAFPAHPRLAHMLLIARSIGAPETGARIAALLSEPPRSSDASDLTHYLDLLAGQSNCLPAQRSWLKRARSLVQTFNRLLQENTRGNPSNSSDKLCDDDVPGYLLACAYPDRIAKKRTNRAGTFQLSSGRTVLLPEQDPLAAEDWLVCPEVSGFTGSRDDRIQLAVALNSALFQSVLSSYVEYGDAIEWDRESGLLRVERRQKIGAITLKTSPAEKPDPAVVEQAITDFIRQHGLALLPWNDSLRQWQARVMLLHSLESSEQENLWPDVSDQHLSTRLEHWLMPYLPPIRKIEDLQKIDLKALLENLLPWPLPQQLSELAPTHLQVPSGARVPIDYQQSPPVLAVKLQEMFGCRNTPTVAGGRVPVVLHLLSPARRPLQITQDLEGFWQSSYHQVKKEMKGRYPKHPWPDDPLAAIATGRTKNRAR